MRLVESWQENPARLTAGKFEYFTPQELGIEKYGMGAIAKIVVGGCPLGVTMTTTWVGNAHTHWNKDKPDHKWVCFDNDYLILKPSGEPHDMLWHEFGHVTGGEKTIGHGPEFESAMAKLGKPEIKGKYVHVNYDDPHFSVLKAFRNY